MKTNLFKLNSVAVLALVAINANGQSVYQNKTCIKIEEIINGKTIQIDTCFVGLGTAEIQKQLNAMGISGTQLANQATDLVKVFSEEETNTNDSAHHEIVIINDDKNQGGKVKIITNENGKCNTIVIGSNGYAYSSASATGKNDSQVEVLVNETNGDSSGNKMNVYVFKMIEVKDVSDSDKIYTRVGIGTQSTTFSALKMYPNPAESSLTISYNSSSSEPLLINVYDNSGKTVYTEKVDEPGTEVSKTISLSAFGPGIYFVNIVQGNQNETKKIIVK